MKKLLLTALLGVFGFVGAFASAGNITFTSSTTEWESFPYSPSSFTINENVSFDYFDVSSTAECDESASYVGCCVIGIRSEQDFESDEICNIESDNTESSCSLTPGTYYVSLSSSDCISYSSITLPVGNSSSSGGAGDSENSPLLSGGTAQLAPVINSIFSVIGEFIPYVVYISIGILIATLGFYAIKRLMNWMYGKIKKYFR